MPAVTVGRENSGDIKIYLLGALRPVRDQISALRISFPMNLLMERLTS